MAMTKQDWIFIFVVIFVSGVIRFSNFLGSSGLLLDAGAITERLFNLGNEGVYGNFLVLNGFNKFLSSWGSIFSDQSLKLQLLPIILGLVCIPAFFYFIKRNFNEFSARLGVVIFSFSFWHMVLSRFIPEVSMGFLITILAVIACWYSFRASSVKSVIILSLLIAMLFNFAFVLWPVAVSLIAVFIVFNGSHERYKETTSLIHTKMHMSKLLGIFIILNLLGLLPVIYLISSNYNFFVESILINSVFASSDTLNMIFVNIRQLVSNIGLSSLNLIAHNPSSAGVLSPVLGILLLLGICHSVFRMIRHKVKDRYLPIGHLFLLLLSLSALIFGIFLETRLAGLSFVTLALVPVFSYISIAINWLYTLISKNNEVRLYESILVSNNWLAKFAILGLVVAVTVFDVSRFLKLVYDTAL